MLSRVAENLYWLGRYLERTENLARLLDNAFQLELDAGLPMDDGEGPLDQLLDILSCRLDFEKYGEAGVTLGRNALLGWLTLERKSPHSILSMVRFARENARGTQEALSAEAWSQINRLYLQLNQPQQRERFWSAPTRFLDVAKRGCLLIAGTIESTLPRDEVYHFLQLGRHLERIDMTLRILKSALAFHAAAPVLTGGIGGGSAGLIAEEWLNTTRWASLLQTCSAHEAYLRRYRSDIEPVGVLHFLFLEPCFPRSLVYGVSQSVQSLKGIDGQISGGPSPNEAERALGRLESELKYCDPSELLEQGIDKFLKRILEATNKVGGFISQTYFMH